MKVRSKYLKNEVSDILEYFSELIKIETKYGESLNAVGNPKFFNQSIIFIEDKTEIEFKIDVFTAESQLLLKKFLNNKNLLKFSLPEWNIFKNGIKIIGKAHKDCAHFIKKGVNEMVFMFNHEYLSESLKIKKQKKEIKLLYEKTIAHLTKMGKDFKEQFENCQKLNAVFEESKSKKEAPTLLMKKDNEIKIAIYQIGKN